MTRHGKSIIYCQQSFFVLYFSYEILWRIRKGRINSYVFFSRKHDELVSNNEILFPLDNNNICFQLRYEALNILYLAILFLKYKNSYRYL